MHATDEIRRDDPAHAAVANTKQKEKKKGVGRELVKGINGLWGINNAPSPDPPTASSDIRHKKRDLRRRRRRSFRLFEQKQDSGKKNISFYI